MNKREHIGLVIFDNSFRNNIINAVQWLNRLRKNDLQLYPKPSCIELYPNMNNKQSSWESEKKKLAEKIKEMTLIWKISYEERNRLISIGINTWDNLYLIKNLYEFRNSDTKYVQEKIIHMNKHNELLIEPRNISQDFKNILQKDSIEFVLDIESVINLEEKGNYFYNKSQNER